MSSRSIHAWLKVAGAVVVFFAAAHLCLNLYIIVLHLRLSADELRSVLLRLSAMVGIVAIPEDVGPAVFFIKVAASLSFLAAGWGLMLLKGWARRPLMALLALRIVYGAVICALHGSIHPHLLLIFFEGVVYSYFLTRPGVIKILQ